MIPLFVQTLLLMGAAYFIGAALACIVRRSLFAGARPAPTVERRVDPLPEVAQRAAEQAPAAASVTIVAAAQPDPGPAQDLKRIRLIDADLEAGLNKLGVRRYEQIAAWMQPDVKRIGGALGLGRRISRENWIEQAQVLAKGGETHYATRRARGEAASAAPTPDEGERRPAGSGAASALPAVSERAAFAHAQASAYAPTSATAPTVLANPLPPTVPSTPPTPAAVPIRPTAPAAHDNLLRISGIDAEVEKLLTSQGVTRYSQIAHWSPADVERFDKQIGSAGRIGRENWIEQAQILSRGGDTKFSLNYDRGARPEAAPSPRPLKLADAIQEHAATRPARADPGARSAGPDDLKRIRGIGVLIEKKLNSLGIVHYEQVANWTGADIERISQILDFKGRIERENWIEQARILATGGQTEFSRRADG